ncbi:MAG: LysR family transcriptional regulator [Burkholderiaceae bacterium]|nr:MAG: LysR family transcriptional regulator [Burkholderiaceae bacterium]
MQVAAHGRRAGQFGDNVPVRNKRLGLNTLQMFVAAATERSMSAAATHTGTTQSAVSQGIRQLEDDLGVVLFDRRRRPLVLTAAGLTLLNRARALLAESARMRSEVLEASRGIAPEVTVGLVDSFAATCGPSFIRELLHKTVRLSVGRGLTPYHGEKLLARELDIAITTDTFEGLDGLVHRRVYSEQFLVLAPKGTVRRRVDREMLVKHAASAPLIRFNSKSHLGSKVETFLRRAGVRTMSRLEVDNADTLVAMVAGGIGWAVTTPTCLIQGLQHLASVQVEVLSGVHGGRSMYVLGREGEHEKLFETCYEATVGAVKEMLLPTLTRLAPHVVDQIQLEPALGGTD